MEDTSGMLNLDLEQTEMKRQWVVIWDYYGRNTEGQKQNKLPYEFKEL